MTYGILFATLEPVFGLDFSRSVIELVRDIGGLF